MTDPNTATITNLKTILAHDLDIRIERLGADLDGVAVRLCAVTWAGIVEYEGLGTLAEAAGMVAKMAAPEMIHE